MGRQSDQNSSLCEMMLGLLKARVIVLVSDWVAFVHGRGGDYWFLFWQCTHFSKLDCEFEPMYRECAHACDVGDVFCQVQFVALHSWKVLLLSICLSFPTASLLVARVGLR